MSARLRKEARQDASKLHAAGRCSLVRPSTMAHRVDSRRKTVNCRFRKPPDPNSTSGESGHKKIPTCNPSGTLFRALGPRISPRSELAIRRPARGHRLIVDLINGSGVSSPASLS
jgi:hypothetical protein